MTCPAHARPHLPFAIVLGAVILATGSAGAQTEPMGPPLYVLEDAYLRWPLPPEDAAYGVIKGQTVKDYIHELTAIARRSRDRGDVYWGRISGTQADRETQEWLARKLRALGLEDVKIQELDMPPHWTPTSWEMSVTGGGTTTVLKSVRPVMWAAPTSAAGLELEPVWVGLGTAADFLGRNVRGRAVLIHTMPTPGMRSHSAVWNGAMRRAQDNGAAAVVLVFGMPGNVSSQLISGGGLTVPLVSVGLGDGAVVRQLLEKGEKPMVRLRLQVEMSTGRKTANVWGTLPGASDEDILIMAHTDGHFDGALDNASGVATMVALAEYFARVPKEQRRRTLRFVGVPAHHTGQGAPANLRMPVGSLGTRWMQDNRATFFAKTALIINCEHTSQTQTYLSAAGMIRSNMVSARRWFAGGSDRFKQLVVNIFDRHGVATYEQPEARPGGELGQVYRNAPSVHVIDHIFYHTDLDTAELIPSTGLESVARAYAKLIDEVNRLDRTDLIAPEGAER